jgi:ATP-dependent DNA helicase UvrD/PcrA
VAHPPSTVAQVRDPLLDDLDAHQRLAVTATDAPLAILAPAGSGKTRVLTRRIAFRVREGSADARHVLAVTFTRKAAGELVHRIGGLGIADDEAASGRVTAGTFHALALAQLRRRAADQRRDPPRVLDHKTRLLARLLDSSGPAGAAIAAEMAAGIEWAKARMVPPEQFVAAARAANRRLPRSAVEVAAVYERYEREKRRRNLLDFDDLLARTAEALERDPEFAAAQQWRFRHVFVDEFQDATPLQLRLLRAWLASRTDLCVVGDPAQAIYGFAGADPTPLADFARHFPGGRSIALLHNFRSAAPVVTTAEAALGTGAEVVRDPPRATRTAGVAPTITAYDSGEAEATAVAGACWRAFADGVPWTEIGILFRTNAQSALFEHACARRGVPFRALTERERFVARPTVRPWVQRLRELERAVPHRTLSEHLADLAVDTLDENVIRELDATELETHRSILLELGREFLACEPGRGSVTSFVAWTDVATADSVPRAAGVDLVTFHRAKGLEWRLTFVCGLEQGLVPISWATTPEARAEERRLLHVALSRAENELRLSWARTRHARDKTVPRHPSPWLGDLERVVRDLPRQEVDPRAELAAVRATLDAAAPPAPSPRRRRVHR